MNNHFNQYGEGEAVKFPKAGYARVDDVEMSRSGKTARVSFDVVDASFIDNYLNGRGDRLGIQGEDSLDFSRMPLFNLQIVFSTDFSVPRYKYRRGQWRGCFDYKCQICYPDKFINYCVVVDAFQQSISNGRGSSGKDGYDESSGWFKIIKSSDTTGHLATVYSGLFSEPEKVRVHLDFADQQKRLSKIFTLPGTRQSQFEAVDLALFADAECDRLVVFDVGQGSASASMSVAGKPEIYFDAGAGVYANKSTRPPGLALDANGVKAVFLSHWDTDHWAGAILSRPGADSLLTKKWYAPDQVVGPRHVAFAKSIEANGGQLILLSPPSLTVQDVPLTGGRILRWAQGSGLDRNDSGLVAAVECFTPVEQSIILPGDCDYRVFKHLRAKSPVGLLVPHHGARLRSESCDVPVPHPQVNDCKLVYSFGPNNKHGKARVRHPTAETIELHNAWDHGGWRSRPGFGAAGHNVRGTSEHSATSRGDICIDWQR